MHQPNILSTLTVTSVALSLLLNPETANAFSLTFNPPGSTSLTINDRAGRGGDTRDTSGIKNEIIFNQTFTTSNGSISASGTFRGSYITYARSLDNTNVGLSTDGINAIILTLTNFKLTNNTSSSLNLSNFLNLNSLASDFLSTSSLAFSTVDFYLSYTGSYQTLVNPATNLGASTTTAIYNDVSNISSNNTITLQGTPQAGNSFSSFASTRASGYYYESGITDVYMTFPSISLVAGASLVLPNSLVSMSVIDDDTNNPLTQEEVELLSELAGEQLQNQSVPEPSSLLGLLGLGGLFTFGCRRSKKAQSQ